MNDLNLSLLHLLSAGDDPRPWLLMFGRSLALWGSVLSVLVLLGTALLRRREWRYLLAVAASAVLASVLAKWIAERIGEPRPFVAGLVPAYIAHNASGGMPSTHATVMFMVAFALLMRAGLRTAGVVLLALAAATTWARVYVGVHYPMDIGAGLLLGAMLAGALRLIFWLRQAAPRPAAPQTEPT